MQPVKRWGRAATVLCSWSRYASSIPKHNSSTERAQVSQIRDASRRKRHGWKDRVIVFQERPRRAVEPTRRSQSLHNDRDIIDPSSLERTLQAHQKANQESIIIRHTRTNTPYGHYIQRKTPVPTIGAHLDLEREDVQEGRGQWEDYIGKVRPLSLDWEVIGSISRNLSVPWMNNLNKTPSSRESAAARLSEEIRAADLYFTPSQAEWEVTNKAVRSLESFVLSADPAHLQLDIIGSRASGLATPLSDLDLNLVLADTHEDPGISTSRLATNRVLINLFRIMRWKQSDHGQFNTAYFASAARVPIIVGTHVCGLEFQIQSASSCYGSLEVVKHLCAEYPTVRALFKIIKQSLKMRGLSDGHHGGLTSYPLINMIAVSLKMNARKTDAFDFGKHLLQFLEYWSTIDLYKTGITHIPSTYLSDTTSSTDPSTFFKTPENAEETISLITQDPVGSRPLEFDVRRALHPIHTPQNNFMLTLHDPANPHNDLGRSAYAIKHIQATFADMLGRLKGDMSEWDRRGRIEMEGGTVAGEMVEADRESLLRGLIGGDYSLYNMERKRVARGGDFVEFAREDVLGVGKVGKKGR